jgi:GTPase SAR1 family protein
MDNQIQSAMSDAGSVITAAVPVITAAGSIISTGTTLYKHRENLQKLSNKLFGKRNKVVITGSAGVGKTVFSNYLTGAAYKQEYTSPQKPSDNLEVTRMDILNQKDRIYLNVIPGQDSLVRREVLQEINESIIDVMIHVVANGMSRLETNSQLLRAGQGQSLHDYRQEIFGKEIDAIDETCELMRSSYFKNPRPQRLLVVFTKVDLYHDSIETAMDRYSEQGQSGFSKRVSILRDQIGSDNFVWDTLPFCGRLDGFTHDGKAFYKPQLTEDQRNKFVRSVREKLISVCKSN